MGPKWMSVKCHCCVKPYSSGFSPKNTFVQVAHSSTFPHMHTLRGSVYQINKAFKLKTLVFYSTDWKDGTGQWTVDICLHTTCDHIWTHVYISHQMAWVLTLNTTTACTAVLRIWSPVCWCLCTSSYLFFSSWSSSKPWGRSCWFEWDFAVLDHAFWCT